MFINKPSLTERVYAPGVLKSKKKSSKFLETNLFLINKMSKSKQEETGRWHQVGGVSSVQ